MSQKNKGNEILQLHANPIKPLSENTSPNRRQVTKKSGAARMNFILSGTASVAMKWMIGSRPKRNLEET